MLTTINELAVQADKAEKGIQKIISENNALNETTIRLAEKRYLHEFQERAIVFQLQVLQHTLTPEMYLTSLASERANLLEDYRVALSGAQTNSEEGDQALPKETLEEMQGMFRLQIEDCFTRFKQFQTDAVQMSKLESRLKDTEETYQDLDSFKVEDFSQYTMDKKDAYKEDIEKLRQKLNELETQKKAIMSDPKFLTSMEQLSELVEDLTRQGDVIRQQTLKQDYFCEALGRNMSLLSIACYYGTLDIVDYLIHKNPEQLNARDSSNLTPLHWAAKGGNDLVVRTLLEKGCNPNVDGEYNRTPLHFAVYSGNNSNNVMCAHYLLEKGANINAEENDGVVKKSPLHVAITRGHVNVVKYLVMQPTLNLNQCAQMLDGQKVQPLFLALEQEIPEIIQIILNSRHWQTATKISSIKSTLTNVWTVTLSLVNQYLGQQNINIALLLKKLQDLEMLDAELLKLEPSVDLRLHQETLKGLLQYGNQLAQVNVGEAPKNLLQQLKRNSAQLGFLPLLENLSDLKLFLEHYADGAWPCHPLPENYLNEVLKVKYASIEERAKFVSKVLYEIADAQDDVTVKQQIMMFIYLCLKQKTNDIEKIQRLKLLKHALNQYDQKWQTSVLKNNLNATQTYSFWRPTVQYSASSALKFEERFNCLLNSKSTENLGVLLGSTFSTNKKERLHERESLILDAVYGGFTTKSENQCDGFVIAVADGSGGHERVDASQYQGNAQLTAETIHRRVLADNQGFLQRDHQIAKVAHLATKYATYFLASYPTADVCRREGKQMLGFLKEILLLKNNHECATLACGRAFALENGYRFIGFNIGDSTLLAWNRKTKTLKTLLPAHVTVVQGLQHATALLPNQYRDFEIHTIDQVLEKECVVIAATDGLLDVLPCIKTEKEYPNKLRYLEIRLDEIKLQPIMQRCANDISLQDLLAHIAQYTVQQVESHRVRLFNEGQDRFQIGDDIALLAMQMPDKSSCNIM